MSTLEFLSKYFTISINIHDTCILNYSRCFEHSYVGLKRNKVILSSKALKYPSYKMVVIDESPKTGFSGMTKLPKTHK